MSNPRATKALFVMIVSSVFLLGYGLGYATSYLRWEQVNQDISKRVVRLQEKMTHVGAVCKRNR
jgi:hypothetical protein